MEIAKILEINDFKEMELLEKKFYGEDHITPYKEVYRWYLKYPYTVVAIKDEEKIIGFINMFPVKEYVFNELKKGTFNDKNLDLDDILDISNCNEDNIAMFLCCIVVDEQYRKSNVVKMLLTESFRTYEDIENKVSFIITDNVTSEGERFSIKLGLEKITETIYDSVIYMGKYSYIKSYI